jgi:HK97 family phage portal protein
MQSGQFSPYPSLGGAAQGRILEIYNRAQSADYGWMYRSSPAVRTVIDVIVRNAGQLDLRLFEEISESERQPQPDHPAAMSLRYPNSVTSSDKFIREMFKDYLIHNNAYALLTPAPAGQISLTRLPAFMVVVQGSSLFSAENYRVWPMGAWTSAGTWGGAGTWKDFSPDEILHWYGEHPLDPRIGLSLLDTIRDVIAEDAALQAATIELAKAGLQEPAWVYRPLEAPAWSNEARQAAEEDITARMRRRNQKPVMLEEGMEVRSFGMSPRDAQMYEIRRWAIERVASLYGVPLGMVGLDPDVAAARIEFLTDCLPPYCEDFTKMLNQRILARVYNWTEGCFEFNLDEKSINADERIKTLVTATGRPVMLTDEARAKLNLKPVKGGDELVTPLNVVVGEKPTPAPGVMPIQDPNGPPQDGSYRSGDGSANTPPAPPAPQKALTKSEPVLPVIVVPNPDDRLPRLHPGQSAEMDRQYQHIDTFKAVVQRHFNRLERSLYAGERGTSKGANRRARRKATQGDWTRWDREFSNDINTALKTIVGNEGDTYAFKLGGSFDMAYVENYLQAMAEGAAGAINDTVRSEIKDLGMDAALARAPQHVASAGTSLGVKSTLWAREEAARQSPFPENRVKTWLADTGGRHLALDGQTVALKANWPAGFNPGGEPGCACSMSIA